MLGASARLADEIEVAGGDPAAWLARYGKKRDVDGPITDLAWYALIEGLTAEGRLHRVDWREFPGEAATTIEALWRRTAKHPKNGWSWMTPAMDDGTMRTAVFLDRAAAVLRRHGVVLAYLDSGADDEFALVVLDAADSGRARKLARAAGYIIGTKLVGRPAPRPLFRRIAVAPPTASPLLAPSPRWKTMNVGPIAHSKAKVLAFRKNENPKSLGSPPRFDRVELTSTRVTLSNTKNRQARDGIGLAYIEKKQTKYYPSEHEGVGLLKLVSFTRERTKGVWRTIPAWHWIICAESFARAFEQAVASVRRARVPR